MKSTSKPNVVMICCSVLRTEVESLYPELLSDHKLRFLPSMLHMHPERLTSSLESLLEGELKQGHHVILIYGDCCARMTNFEVIPGVVRTRGKNCCELLLGSMEYRKLSHEGDFFLIPEWARRWKEIFSTELGLNQDNATCLMQDIHRRLMYLDTGLATVPESELKECSEFCGLPYEIQQVSLDLLHSTIEESLCTCITKGAIH